MNEQLDEIWQALEALRARVGVLEAGAAPASAPAPDNPYGKAGAVADDRELDSRYGDPNVYRDPTPRYWKGGGSFKGRPYSTCPPDYLRALANYLDACAFMSDRDGHAQRAGYQRKDAARARGWALRIAEAEVARARAPQQTSFRGAEPPPRGMPDDSPSAGQPLTNDDDEIPF